MFVSQKQLAKVLQNALSRSLSALAALLAC
jgi:hypothetical protein